MNTFQDHFFDYHFRGDLNLLYCGNRERSIDHRYVHTQNAYLLTYVVEGSATLSVSGKKIPLKAGDLFVSYPSSGASYITKTGVPWSIRWVTLTGTQPESLLPLMGFAPDKPCLPAADPARAEQILAELFAIALKDDLKNKLYALSLLYELLSAVSPSSAPVAGNKTVSNAVAFISEHYGDKELSVESLAATAFLNTNYFSKLFTAHTGISPGRFISKTRMEKAKKLLTFTQLSVAGVAIAVGFSDPLYFSRSFRRYTGLSPSQFRAASK
ncbi:MAG: AraC family transcriptional regulator [Ruminococcaceae bacterium]|nr:AraC family transcriptional regulator [Oscillospiraceae bacterium]